MQHLTATQAGTFTVEQNKVLRNTYMMLALTMIPTVIGAFVGETTRCGTVRQGALEHFARVHAGLAERAVEQFFRGDHAMLGVKE